MTRSQGSEKKLRPWLTGTIIIAASLGVFAVVSSVLQGLDKRKAALAEAQQDLAMQQAKLAQTMAGESKIGDVAAQEANIAQLEAKLRTESAEKKAFIARTEAELRNDRLNYDRYQTLLQEGAVNTSNMEEKRKNLEISQAKLDEANAQLENVESTLNQLCSKKSASRKRRWIS
jgi:HlyD family secretion protein